ncbi:MAG: ion transporter [Methylobacterium sp.]|nr:ion transporter [Methylobacterium sp.]
MARSGARMFRKRCHEVLDGGAPHDAASRRVHRGIVALILVSVMAVILESVPSMAARFGPLFQGIEFVAALVFTVEYVARLWAAVEHPLLRPLPAWRARLNYAVQPVLLVDLLAVLPFYLALVGPADFQVLLIFRLIRFFKLARYSPGMRSLLEAIRAERRALLACLVILGGLMIVTAAIMHVVEGPAQPGKFGSIPEAMYWSIITLTTVGYGDVHPVTNGGKVLAGFTAVLGLVMLSLPVGIIATSFAEVIHRRDFVVTWNMVARVPLFATLNAGEIATIMRFLRSRVLEGGEVLVRRDEPSVAMFFIASGAVEIEMPGHRLRMETGQFFGEAALFSEAHRTGTVRALEATHLLALDRDDFRMLMEQDAEIARSINEAIRSQRMLNPVEPGGDIARAELHEKKPR